MFSFNDWPKLIQQAKKNADSILLEQENYLNDLLAHNHVKVLNAFQEEKVSSYHLHGSTGYGLGDSGRDTLDLVFARILGAEAALVRGQFVSGTHAIACALFGILRPGDHLLSISGKPYDTLEEVIGLRGSGQGSLKDLEVDFDLVPLDQDGQLQYELIKSAVTPRTRLLMVQRSRGYSWRNSISITSLAKLVSFVKKHFPGLLIFVDNCYGELVEKQEPCNVGADLIAGSLIKNLGGSIAPSGGYVAGKRALVKLAAQRLTAPGIGAEVGATFDWQRQLYQGLFFSPLTVVEALKGAIFSAAFWQSLGYEVHPQPASLRTDLIQAVKLSSREKLIAFCQGLQKGTPIDAYVLPIPGEMPGYTDEVIMAGGTFIQGATSEFSADGPLRDPYIVYQQGGISHTYVIIGNISAALSLWEKGLL